MLMKTKEERRDILTNATMLMIIKDLRFATHDVDDNKDGYRKSRRRVTSSGCPAETKSHVATNTSGRVQLMARLRSPGSGLWGARRVAGANPTGSRHIAAGSSIGPRALRTLVEGRDATFL
jgi:hypothetical protein